MSTPMQQCPASTTYPQMYGLQDPTADYYFTGYNPWIISIDFNQEFMVAGGFSEIKSSKFLPESVVELVLCEGLQCAEKPDYPFNSGMTEVGLF